MNNPNITRTSEEIVSRIKQIAEDGEDFFAVERGHLARALPWELAKEFYKDGATEDDHVLTINRAELLEEARSYMPFAVGKMEDERGLSANRSIGHYSGWVWLLTDDVTHEKYSDAPYGWYGRNQLELAAEILGFKDHFAELLTDDD